MQYHHTHHDIQHYQPGVDLPPEEVAGRGPSMGLIAAVIALIVLAVAVMVWSPWDGGEPNRIPDSQQPGQPAPAQQVPSGGQPQIPRR